jgi:hypothetical protein
MCRKGGANLGGIWIPIAGASIVQPDLSVRPEAHLRFEMSETNRESKLTVSPDQKREYIKLLVEGWTQKEASQQCGFSERTGKTIKKEYVDKIGPLPKIQLAPTSLEIPGPKQYYELDQEPQKCLDDFGRFRARYFGRRSSPWQEDAAEVCRKKLSTPYKEYGVVNCPPGSGKSTLFTHDIPAWLTARDRAIRGLIGSSNQVMANQYCYRLRMSLERKIPMQAKSDELAGNLSFDAVSTLAADYGRFRPLESTVPWARTAFIVEQYFATSTDEKEATWSAFGRDAEFLGTRINIAVWDDLVTRAALKTLERIEGDRLWWMDQAESRIEPGGLLILQGQRLHPEDLYRFCLNMDMPIDEFGEEVHEDAIPKKYFHVVYRAHYDEKCEDDHSRGAKPYDPKDPEESGCLLDPVRLPWRELKTIMAQPLSNFEVVYQQQDVDPEDVLVPQIWLDGGFDPDTKETLLGCFAEDWAPLTIPKDLNGEVLSVVSVDPSPTKFWSIQWWLYVQPPQAEPLMGFRYLMDIERKPMSSEELLDWNVGLGTWTGLLEDWFQRSKEMGQRISTVIIEQNAAQRFLFKYSWFKRWMSIRGVDVRPHNTTTNKLDPEFGVWTIRNHYRYGRVVLPGTPEGKRLVAPLTYELTRYTRYEGFSTDDCVMANWFFEYQLQYLKPGEIEIPDLYNDIPSWIKDKPSVLA